MMTRVAFVGANEIGKDNPVPDYLPGKWNRMPELINGELPLPSAYFPKDNTKDFDCDDTIVDWLTQYS